MEQVQTHFLDQKPTIECVTTAIRTSNDSHLSNFENTSQSGQKMFSNINTLLETSDGSDGFVSTIIGGVTVKMMVDSGASVNAVSPEVYNFLALKNAKLFNITFDPVRELHAYASESKLRVTIRFNAMFSVALPTCSIKKSGPSEMEEFYVVENANRCLLGRITSFKHNILAMGSEVMEWRSRNGTTNKPFAQQNFIFELSCPDTKGFEAFNMEPVKLNMRKDVFPTKIRYTNIPFNMREEANRQILELTKLDVIEEVTDTSQIDWISSMLAVVKQNGKIRLVVDLRGPNKGLLRDSFRMPTLELVVSKLTGSKFFSTIDLTNAFYHVMLDDSSRHITTFWTGEKYYRFKRLPFGLSSAPDIFQRALQDVVLKGCKNTLNYLDDILVYSETLEEHETILGKVMNRLEKHNVKLNLEKCSFRQRKVKFLGFDLGADGMSITDDRLKAFSSLREPESVSEVKSYLGMLTFLERFIVDRASKTVNLRKITNSGVFIWTENAQKEFENIKETELKRISSLGFYNKEWKTELLVDASPNGLGAILVQYDNGKKLHVICCASKALTPIEQRYPQQHREALALTWGVERFRFYLLGIKFVVRTDNRANEFIFGTDAYLEGKRAVSRSQLFALRLQPYNFETKRISGENNAADALSRLIPRKQIDAEFSSNAGEEIFSIIDSPSPITIDDLEAACQKDSLFSKIKNGHELDRWEEETKGLRGVKEKLKFWGNTLLYEKRFYIPESLRLKTLEIAHIGHVSASSMKQLLRAHVWWPGMTVDIDSMHAECRGCTLTSRRNCVPPLSPRGLPNKPLESVHLDFLKVTGIGDLLVATDAYSRYLWVIEMKSTTTKSTNRALSSICDIWGKPAIWQSDNGPQFASREFKNYWKNEGVNHRTTIPYASHTNGLVERHNGPILHAIKTALCENKPWRKALTDYVKAYNTRPHSTTLFSPFHLLQGRKYHDYLPILESWDGTYEQPPSHYTVKTNHDRAKVKQKKYYDIRNKTRDSGIREGDWVILKNTNRVNKMEPKFLVPRFRVMRLYKAKAIVRSTDGKDFIRWVGHLKHDVGHPESVSTREIDAEILSELLESELNIEQENDEETPSYQENPPIIPTHQDTPDKSTEKKSSQTLSNSEAAIPLTQETPEVSSKINLRNRKLINMPARYLDCVFTIFD